MLVALAILSIVLASVFDVMRVSTQGFAKGDTEASLVTELEHAIALLRADLRSACVDAEAGRALELTGGGTELKFLRAVAEPPGSRSSRVEILWAFDGSSKPPRLRRKLVSAGGLGPPAEERVISTSLTRVRFSVYSCLLEAPMLSYASRVHPDYAPLLLRIELTAGSALGERNLVTSVALQPYTKRQLDPHWNPVPAP